MVQGFLSSIVQTLASFLDLQQFVGMLLYGLLQIFMGATLAPSICGKILVKVKCPDDESLQKAIIQSWDKDISVQCDKPADRE